MGESLSYTYAWTRNTEYPYANWLLLIALCLSVGTNILFLSLHTLIKPLRAIYSSRLVIPLSMANLIHATICIIQCLVNMTSNYYQGEMYACIFQAFYSIMITSWTSACLALIVYCSYKLLVKNERLTGSRIRKIMLGLVVYSTLVGLLTTSASPEPAQLLSSGTYCIPNVWQPQSGIVFYGGVFLPILTVATYWYVQMYKTVLSMTQYLQAQGIECEPRPKQLKMIRFMSILVLLTLTCYAPFVIGNIYEWITWMHAPPLFYAIGGFTSHMPGFINPIIYFVLNQHSWLIVKHKVHKWLFNYARPEDHHINNVELTDYSTHHVQGPEDIKPTNNDYNDRQIMHTVLLQPTSRALFLAFCMSEYNQENILFWERVMQFKSKIKDTFLAITFPAVHDLNPSPRTSRYTQPTVPSSPRAHIEGSHSSHDLLTDTPSLTSYSTLTVNIPAAPAPSITSLDEATTPVSTEENLRDIFRMARNIYLTFVADNGPLTLNISSSDRKAQTTGLGQLGTMLESDGTIVDHVPSLGVNIDWKVRTSTITIRNAIRIESVFNDLLETVETIMQSDSFLRYARQNNLMQAGSMLPIVNNMKQGNVM